MKSPDEILTIILSILKKNDVCKAGLFGSYAKGEYDEESDIDLLVEFRGDKSLLDLVGLKIELEEKTGKKFDVITYSSLYPRLRDIILSEAISLL